MKANKLYVVIALFVLFCFAERSSSSLCPCSDPSLCTPLNAPPRPELFAFQTTNSTWKNYDWDKLTTVAVFRQLDPADQMICFAHSRGVRVVLGAFFDVSLLSSPSARSTWVQLMLNQTLSSFMDGINIDIEDVIKKGSPQERDLTLLVQEAVEVFHKAIPGSQVTFDVAWSPDCIDGRCYDYPALAASVDFLVVMAYDERSQVKEGPCIASANSPASSLDRAVKQYLSIGVKRDKLVIALPWYGYNYTCINPQNSTICPIALVPFRGVSCSDAAGTQVPYGTIMKDILPLSSSGLQWDDRLQSPWFDVTLPSGQYQFWLDNPRSISTKVSVASQHRLRGVGMWYADALDYTDHQQVHSMWSSLNDFFAP